MWPQWKETDAKVECYAILDKRKGDCRVTTEAYVSKTVFKGDVCVPGDPKTAVGFNSPHSVGPGEELSLLGLCSEVFFFVFGHSIRKGPELLLL